MDDVSTLTYFKGLVLWNLATDRNPYVDCILNPVLSPSDLSRKTQGLRELIDDKIFGYRLFRKPGAYVDDFTLEKGYWTKDEYLHDWTYFAIFNQQDLNKTIERLIRSIYYYIQENNVDINNLLDELWYEYWILDIEVYSFIRHKLQYGDFAPPIEDIENLYIQISDKILLAKTESKDLDEWIDKLHTIVPLVMYGTAISHFDDEEAKRYNRFFEEAKADIIAVFAVAFHGAIINDELFFTKDYAPLYENDETTFLRKLKYTYNSRVSIPKYWYELAKGCFNNDIAVLLLSEPMNKLDTFNLTSMFCHLSTFHVKNCLEYISTGKYPQTGDGEIFIEH